MWVADITYVPTLEGFVYLATVLDVFSRKVVGWAMSARQTVNLVQSALEMAVTARAAPGVVLHSDRGSQYTALVFTRQCAAAGIERSMGSAGDCFDNAMAESLFATVECELLQRVEFATRAEAGASLAGSSGRASSSVAPPRSRTPRAMPSPLVIVTSSISSRAILQPETPTFRARLSLAGGIRAGLAHTAGGVMPPPARRRRLDAGAGNALADRSGMGDSLSQHR